MERNEQQSSLLRMKPPESQMKAQQHQPPPPPQNCPRCDSSNTKFCYYNNYSLSQPRYFCKACRRYWTHGGTLRNVPVGGGCRRGKRPKPSIPSSSSSEIGDRTLSSSPAPSSQSLMSMNQGQGFPPFQPVMSSVGNAFYTSGSFLSSLAAMQSLPAEVNQRASANLGGGNTHYDVDMAVLQGVSRHSLISQPAPHQFQMQNEYFPSHQALNVPPSRPLAQWTQNFINGVPATTSSAASSGFLGGNAANSDIQAGSSFNPNHFPDSNTRIDPQ